MFWTNFKRIMRAGGVHFWRNGVVSLASVLVMTVTLFVISSLIFMSALLQATLEEIKGKVDVNIYFNTQASEEDIFSIRDSLGALPEVANAEYISREQALEDFRERHKDDFLTLQALEELDDNPLGASLNIRAKETSQYESIARFLESRQALSESGDIIIDKINYYQNKVVIDRLSRVIDGSEKIGLTITVALIIISLVIVFNTIRLTIYISREEISVMKLVGASHMYVRGPFIIEGILYGLISSFLVMVILYPITIWIGDITEQFFGGINVFDYYVENFGEIFLITFGSGVLLGITSSFLAVTRYLKK